MFRCQEAAAPLPALGPTTASRGHAPVREESLQGARGCHSLSEHLLLIDTLQHSNRGCPGSNSITYKAQRQIRKDAPRPYLSLPQAAH